jgi:UDP-N-acetylmuramoyl-tripeptide--D-alanyl-D-alanine ligase
MTSTILLWTTSIVALANLSKWLRIAQAEHYIPGRTTRIALDWGRLAPASWILALVGLPLLAATHLHLGSLVALAMLFSPLGLPVLGGEKRLKLTPRALRLLLFLAAVTFCGQLVLGERGSALLAILAPLVVDVTLSLFSPIERALSLRFVRRAQGRLREVSPTTIAITGSYGKTTTKNYLHHLLKDVVVTTKSPASWNNLMGVTRTINETISRSTQVLVLEMGTYGPGEIAEMCHFFPPKIAVIVSIGEAHLERMKTRQTIVASKSEILKDAETWVLNVDEPELAEIASRANPSVEVIRCSTRRSAEADVCVLTAGAELSVVAGDEVVATLAKGNSHPINVAAAVATALRLGVPRRVLANSLQHLPVVENRTAVAATPTDIKVIDDTFNSNPEGARKAAELGESLLRDGGSLWVVTPGMIELGQQQRRANAAFAARLPRERMALLAIVGRINRAALKEGASQGALPYRCFRTRREAAAHVMSAAKPGDVVLYENDLPDHLP